MAANTAPLAAAIPPASPTAPPATPPRRRVLRPTPHRTFPRVRHRGPLTARRRSHMAAFVAAASFVPPAALAAGLTLSVAESNGRPAPEVTRHAIPASAVFLAAGPAPAARLAPCGATGEVRSPPPGIWVRTRYPPARTAALSTGAGVTVAVIDSGVDPDHPLLAGRVTDGRDYLEPGGDGTRDCVGHGTAVASIIVGASSPDGAVHGLAPRARILPVRVSEQQWVAGTRTGRTVAPAAFASAIRWAVDRGADVLNLSVVLTADHTEVRTAIEYATAHDTVVVAAAGNQGEAGNPRPYPAAYPGVLGVGAVGPDGTRLPFSQVGSYVDIVAPGTDIPAAAPAGKIGQFSGTSYAAPFVSAAAALLRSAHPDHAAADVARHLMATADPAPGSREAGYGAGIVNPYRALTETVTTAAPRHMAPLPPPTTDPVAAAASAREQHARERALRFASWATAATIAVLLLGTALPHGTRRWQPSPHRP